MGLRDRCEHVVSVLMSEAAVDAEPETALGRRVIAPSTAYSLVGVATLVTVINLTTPHVVQGRFGALLNFGPAVLLTLALGAAWQRAHLGLPSVLDRRFVLGCCGLALALASIGPVRNSQDLWAYAMYGRIESVHHDNAYTHKPYEYVNDPYLARMSPRWRGTESVYGPVFNEYAAAVTWITGSSTNATRIAFKASAAIAVMAGLVLLDRRRVNPTAIAFAGLHPATVLFGVAGGHNDAAVGLGVLIAVLLASRRRIGWAAVAIAFACLVKVAAGLGIVGLAAWLWYRPDARGKRDAVVFTGISGALVGFGYLLAGGPAALKPLQAASHLVSWNSYWLPVSKWLDSTPFGGTVTTLATLVVLVVAVLIVLRHRHDVGPEVLVTALLLVYLVASAYSLTWYLLWVLPVASLRWRTASSWLVVVVATAYLLPTSEHLGFYATALMTLLLLIGASIRHRLLPKTKPPAPLDVTATPLSPT